MTWPDKRPWSRQMCISRISYIARHENLRNVTVLGFTDITSQTVNAFEIASNHRERDIGKRMQHATTRWKSSAQYTPQGALPVAFGLYCEEATRTANGVGATQPVDRGAPELLFVLVDYVFRQHPHRSCVRVHRSVCSTQHHVVWIRRIRTILQRLSQLHVVCRCHVNRSSRDRYQGDVLITIIITITVLV